MNVRLRALAERSGSQPGDPVRAAEAIIAAVQMAKPPRHLVLGASGFDFVRGKLIETLQELEAWKDTSVSADYPKGEQVRQEESR